MIKSRFDKKVVIPVLSLFAISFLLSLALMQLVAGLVFIMWLFEKNDEKRKAVGMIFYAVIIFGLVRLVTVFLSDFPSSSYEIWYKEAIFYTTAVSLSFYYKSLEKDDIIKILNFFIIGAVLISLIGIYRFYSGDVDRAQSFSGSYTAYSSYLLVAFSFSLFFFKNYSKKANQIIWSLVYFILFLGIFTSLGRANLFITVLIFLIALVLKQIKPLQMIILSLLVVGLFGLNILFPSERIEQRAANITQLSDRDIIWGGAIKIIFEKPFFGYGPRTFSEVFPLKEKFQDKGVGGWHNDFLQIYFESGIIGLISFLFLLYILFKELLKQIRNKIIPEEFRKISLSILFVLISLILTAFFSGFITSVYISVVFIFFIMLVDRISIEKLSSEKT